MIGSDDVSVTGLTKGGAELPVLVGGGWPLPRRCLDRILRA